MELGNKLKKLRKEYDYTQQKIADKLYITAQAVSKWENNKSVPDLTTIVKISDLYNVSLDYLIKSDEQLQNRLSVKNIHLKIRCLIAIPAFLLIVIFTSILVKAEFFTNHHSIGGWLIVGSMFLFIIFSFLSIYFYIKVKREYFIFLWSAIFMLSCIISIGLFYDYIIRLLF